MKPSLILSDPEEERLCTFPLHTRGLYVILMSTLNLVFVVIAIKPRIPTFVLCSTHDRTMTGSPPAPAPKKKKKKKIVHFHCPRSQCSRLPVPFFSYCLSHTSIFCLFYFVCSLKDICASFFFFPLHFLFLLFVFCASLLA